MTKEQCISIEALVTAGAYASIRGYSCQLISAAVRAESASQNSAADLALFQGKLWFNPIDRVCWFENTTAPKTAQTEVVDILRTQQFCDDFIGFAYSEGVLPIPHFKSQIQCDVTLEPVITMHARAFDSEVRVNASCNRAHSIEEVVSLNQLPLMAGDTDLFSTISSPIDSDDERESTWVIFLFQLELTDLTGLDLRNKQFYVPMGSTAESMLDPDRHLYDDPLYVQNGLDSLNIMPQLRWQRVHSLDRVQLNNQTCDVFEYPNLLDFAIARFVAEGYYDGSMYLVTRVVPTTRINIGSTTESITIDVSGTGESQSIYGIRSPERHSKSVGSLRQLLQRVGKRATAVDPEQDSEHEEQPPVSKTDE